MKLRPNVKVDAETPLLEAVSAPWSRGKQTHPDDSTTLLQVTVEMPRPTWTVARIDKHGRRFPQSIAHRGYKAQHPENTLDAFKGAVKVGANALETDIHVTSDDVVVLSHDADLRRCFGNKKKIIHCNWTYLSQLRTIQAPHEPMSRLKDLLSYVARPGLEHLWLLLDIKLGNNPDNVMRLVAQTIGSVPPNPNRAWADRILLGIRAAKYLPLCTKYAPEFPITHIGFSTSYARHFLNVPNVGFNILQKVLLGPIGARFIKDVRDAGRDLLVWTVNKQNRMKWCIQKEVDGVITDDPRRFNEVCHEWKDDEPSIQITWPQWLYTFWLYFIVAVFPQVFKWEFPERVEQFVGPGGQREVKARCAQKIAEAQ